MTDPEVIVDQARGLNGRGVSTTTMGVGNDFNEDLLVPMAQAAGGNHWFIESPEDFPRIFETELAALARETASRVRLRIRPEPGCGLDRVLNDFEETEGGWLRLPNLMAGEPLDIVLQLALPALPAGQYPAFRADLEWTPRGGNGPLAMSRGTTLEFAPAPEAGDQAEDPDVQKALSLLEAAQAKREAREFLDAGDAEGAKQTIERFAAALAPAAMATRDQELMEEMEELNTMAGRIDDPAQSTRMKKDLMYASELRRTGKKHLMETIKSKRGKA